MSLDNKTRELVAIGAAIGGDCIPCLIWHCNKSIEFGATINELRDAIEMAKKVKEVPFKKTLEAADAILAEKSGKMG